MVELSVAMHYVFDSPQNKIVFDVSHPCYTHKILTERKEAFINPEQYDTISGFTNALERGIIEGGYGQKIASYYGIDSKRVKNYGL